MDAEDYLSLREGAAAMFEFFRSLTEAGFTEYQALAIVVGTITSQAGGEGSVGSEAKES